MIAFKIIRGFLQIGVEKWAIVAKMPQFTSQLLDADLMVINDGWQTHHHHQLSRSRSRETCINCNIFVLLLGTIDK